MIPIVIIIIIILLFSLISIWYNIFDNNEWSCGSIDTKGSTNFPVDVGKENDKLSTNPLVQPLQYL